MLLEYIFVKYILIEANSNSNYMLLKTNIKERCLTLIILNEYSFFAIGSYKNF